MKMRGGSGVSEVERRSDRSWLITHAEAFAKRTLTARPERPAAADAVRAFSGVASGFAQRDARRRDCGE
jgi:hypothetical protein